MSVLQEGGRICSVVALQADHGGAVTLPVFQTQPVGFVHIHTQRLRHTDAHAPVNRLENAFGGIVQGVIQIKQPDGFIWLTG